MTGFVALRFALPCLFILIGIALAHTGTAALEYPSEKPSVDSGLEIYMHNCAGCHGEKGDGLGINGKVDFTNQMYMINRNSSEFFDVINDGTKNMPSFENVSKPRKWDSVAYVWTFWADRPGAMRGKNIFEKNCASCHGMKGDGSGLPGAFDFTNLSNTIANAQASIYFDSVSNGVPNTAMPPWKSTLSEKERWDSVKYVWTFQFRDYPVSSIPTTPITSPATPLETPSAGKGWYNTPVGAAILIISLMMLAGIIYLFMKGVFER